MKQIDVLEFERRRKVVLAGLRLLQAVYAGDKAPDDFARNIFILSYQFTDLGAIDEAQKVMDNIRPDYFKNALPDQMLVDPMLFKIAQRTAEVLVREGRVVAPVYYVPEDVQVQPGRGLA